MSEAFPDCGLDAQTYVIEENGRWVVYLDVALASDRSDEPFRVVRRRIRDFATMDEAEVAARFIGRGASRTLSKPPSGF
ncbi:MAG: hypothetical protein AAGD38_09695 [Acidobacteriota bacterium]